MSKYLSFFRKQKEKYKKNIVNEGLDWLRLVYKDLYFLDYLFEFSENSSLGNVTYLGQFEVQKHKTSIGIALQFSVSVEMPNGFSKPVSVCRFLKVTKKNMKQQYLLDFYGSFFALQKLGKIKFSDIFETLEISNMPFSVSRCDYQFTFYQNPLKKGNFFDKKVFEFYKFTNFTKEFESQYAGQTFSYGLYEKNGKTNDGKVKYRFTSTTGIRFYNKSQNVKDLGISFLYPEIKNEDFWRFEIVFGKKIFSGKTFKSLDDFFNHLEQKFLGEINLYEKKESTSYLYEVDLENQKIIYKGEYQYNYNLDKIDQVPEFLYKKRAKLIAGYIRNFIYDGFSFNYVLKYLNSDIANDIIEDIKVKYLENIRKEIEHNYKTLILNHLYFYKYEIKNLKKVLNFLRKKI